MNKLLILSDSFSEHMAALSYSDYKQLIEADEIVLIGENHNISELSELTSLFPVSLVNAISEFNGNKLLVLGDDTLLQKISPKINVPELEFMMIPNPFDYHPTELFLAEEKCSLYSTIPVIMILTFSQCSSIVNVELMLDRAFTDKKVELNRDYMVNTETFLDALYENNPEKFSDFYFSSYQSEVAIKSVYIDEHTLKNSAFSQIVGFFEKIHPDYTILCLDADPAKNKSHLALFRRILGKEPNAIVHSPYYEYLLRENIIMKVYSKGLAETVVNESSKKNELIANLFSKISLPNDISIL